MLIPLKSSKQVEPWLLRYAWVFLSVSLLPQEDVYRPFTSPQGIALKVVEIPAGIQIIIFFPFFAFQRTLCWNVLFTVTEKLFAKAFSASWIDFFFLKFRFVLSGPALQLGASNTPAEIVTFMCHHLERDCEQQGI